MVVLYYIIWGIILTVLQPTLARGIEIWGIAPNLFLCFIIIISFFRGKSEGAIVGAVFGLLYDLLVGRMIGVSSMIFLPLNYLAGMFGNQFFGSGKLMICAVTAFIATLFYGIFYYFARKIGWNDTGFITAFFRISVIEGLYNCVTAFVLMFPVRWMMKVMRIKRMV